MSGFRRLVLELSHGTADAAFGPADAQAFGRAVRSPRRGVGAVLIDALTRLAIGRGAKQLTSEVSDTARASFEKQGFVAQRRNLIQLDGEWLANTTMVKSLVADSVRPATSKLH